MWGGEKLTREGEEKSTTFRPLVWQPGARCEREGGLKVQEAGHSDVRTMSDWKRIKRYRIGERGPADYDRRRGK